MGRLSQTISVSQGVPGVYDIIKMTSAATLEVQPNQVSAELESNYSIISPVEDVKIITSDSVPQGVPGVDDIIKKTLAGTLEEQPNQELLQQEKKFTEELISFILYEDFEYGIDTNADVFVRRHMALDAIITKDWLGTIYVENMSNIPVLIGLLRIVARLDYQQIKPLGQLIAMAALNHDDIEVQECGVRAFESWEAIDSLNLLERLKVSPKWLQDYINEVASDLREEYNVFVHQEDYQG